MIYLQKNSRIVNNLVFRPKPYSVRSGNIVYITFINFKLTWKLK